MQMQQRYQAADRVVFYDSQGRTQRLKVLFLIGLLVNFRTIPKLPYNIRRFIYYYLNSLMFWPHAMTALNHDVFDNDS
jgi:hypothetical protein